MAERKPVSYHEGRFPPENLDWGKLIPLIGPTAAAIARYDGVLAAIPNSAVLLSPLTSREAVLSSSIEGTHATMSEILSLEAGAEEAIPEERRDEIQEVLNYRRALNEAQRLLQDLPLSQRVITAAHKVLLEGVRGTYRQACSRHSAQTRLVRLCPGLQGVTEPGRRAENLLTLIREPVTPAK